MHYLGLFAIKQQAAAAYDSAARLHHGNAVCNYDNQMDADEAIREASQINGLINAGFMVHGAHHGGIWSYEEALQQLMAHGDVADLAQECGCGCFEKSKEGSSNGESNEVRKGETTELERERAAVIADLAGWDLGCKVRSAHGSGEETQRALESHGEPSARADGAQEVERAGATHAAWWA
jgi:hypothetical protein